MKLLLMRLHMYCDILYNIIVHNKLLIFNSVAWKLFLDYLAINPMVQKKKKTCICNNFRALIIDNQLNTVEMPEFKKIFIFV